MFTDTDCSSTVPAALYGCGTGGDGAPYQWTGEFGKVPAVEIGLCYATGVVRFEVLVEYRPQYTFEGRANFLAPDRRQDVSAKLSSVSGMLAGFVDLAALGLPKPGPFAPFLGAGIGAAHTRIGKTTMAFPATTTTVPGGSRTGLAWMATAGVAVAFDTLRAAEAPGPRSATHRKTEVYAVTASKMEGCRRCPMRGGGGEGTLERVPPQPPRAIQDR